MILAWLRLLRCDTRREKHTVIQNSRSCVDCQQRIYLYDRSFVRLNLCEISLNPLDFFAMCIRASNEKTCSTVAEDILLALGFDKNRYNN